MSLNIILTLILRQLRHVEGLLSELDSPLATEAQQNVHKALLNVETLERLEPKPNPHVLGNRGA